MTTVRQLAPHVAAFLDRIDQAGASGAAQLRTYFKEQTSASACLRCAHATVQAEAETSKPRYWLASCARFAAPPEGAMPQWCSAEQSEGDVGAGWSAELGPQPGADAADQHRPQRERARG